jgi:hypothetical protein
MARKVPGYEDITWINPLKSVSPRPYFGDEIWPDDPRDTTWEKAILILKRFYCSERDTKQEDLDALNNYLENPEKYMIIWGDVGIGKTWFIRYELLAGENSMQNKNYHAGVIDMLSEIDTEFGVYRQLRNILEEYFKRFCGGVNCAIEEYVKYDIAALKIKSVSQLTEAELEDVKMISRKWFDLRNEPSKDATVVYVTRLLDILQHSESEELLILAIDNIDKTRDEEQEHLVKLAVRILRKPHIRLIIPLRISSALLRDRFSVLKEFSYYEMYLTPVNLREMLKPRLNLSRDGKSLKGSPKVTDIKDGKDYTFPILFNILFGQDEKKSSDTGSLLLTLAASNAREFLAFTQRVLCSDQLKGLKNICDPEYAIASLMLSDSSQPTLTSCIVNLFDNEEPDVYGNALIRFRVFEYFWNTNNITTSESRFQNYFRRLGYDLGRVKKVLELFVMTQILISKRGYSPEYIKNLILDDIGQLEITKSGKEYKNLLNRIWYYASVKRDVYLPEAKIRKDPDGREYCTHTEFIEWLKEEEQKEEIAIRDYIRKNGDFKIDWDLLKPYKLAAQALKPRNEME